MGDGPGGGVLNFFHPLQCNHRYYYMAVSAD